MVGTMAMVDIGEDPPANCFFWHRYGTGLPAMRYSSLPAFVADLKLLHHFAELDFGLSSFAYVRR